MLREISTTTKTVRSTWNLAKKYAARGEDNGKQIKLIEIAVVSQFEYPY
jgi:hypothetical protein